MLDDMNRPMTISMFLEVKYDETALFTLKDQDYIYKGKYLPSMKRLYLKIADPTEYEFATTVLLSWKHWQKMCDNKVLRKHIDEWRFELEYKLRSQGVRNALLLANAGNFNAAKWVADRGWESRGAGRPSKAEVERQTKIEQTISEEYSAEIHRMANYK